MTNPVTLDDWLGQIYTADRKGIRETAIIGFKAAIAGNPALKTEAQNRLAEYKNLIQARGRATCSFSAKYHDFLEEGFS